MLDFTFYHFVFGLRSVMLRLVTLSVCVWTAMAHSKYRDAIPNGHSVPDPCGEGIWECVGHYNPRQHTSLKNPFAQVSSLSSA